MSRRPRPDPRLPFAIVLAVSMVLGALETLKGYLAGRSAPNTFGWHEAFLTNMPWWLLWALLAPFVFLLVRRVPLAGPRRLAAVALHVAVSAVLALFHLGVSAVIVWAAVAHTFRSLPVVIRELVVGYVVTDIVTYWAIVAGYSTWVAARRLDSAERETQALQLRAAQLEAESVRLRALMTEARLDALRLELNPHFLFNTLNTVSALARRGDAETAAAMLARLSDLLRRTLDGERDQEVRLDEELDMLELYLDIERLRFGDRLTVRIAVDPDVTAALVPSLLLQPLVENAVRHGVATVRGAVRIELTARRSRETVEIRVTDFGRGFEAPDGPGSEGIGLRNTRSRLQALYGDAARLAFTTPDAGGATVFVRIPLRFEEDIRVEA